VKVIIAGSRSITDLEIVKSAIERAYLYSGILITEVISGCASGVDSLGESWAYLMKIPVKRFRPLWERYGKAAGKIRNGEMVKEAEAAIFVWDGKSKGTKDCIDRAIQAGLKIHIEMPGEE